VNTRVEAAFGFGDLEHGDDRTVLRTAARVDALQLGHDRARKASVDVSKAHQWSVPDQVEHRPRDVEVAQVHASILVLALANRPLRRQKSCRVVKST
jgi:hypothetical protein